MKKKERAEKRGKEGITTATSRIAKQIEGKTGFETRIVVPGHIMRGGSPSSYDRVLASQFGVYAASLVNKEIYGVAVGERNNKVVHTPLGEVAGKTKFVPADDQMVETARSLGISFGD